MFFGLIHSTDRARKIITAAVLLLLTAAGILIYFFWGKPAIAFVTDAQRVHTYIKLHPFLSRLFFIFAVFMQVIVAVIPGEPFELGAGYAFGAVEGCIICLIGTCAASAVIFLAVKRFGQPAVELFFSKEKIASIKIFQNEKKLKLIVFIVFFIPGTPKDILTYTAALTPIKMIDWLLISTFARIPSIITSTIAGNVFGQNRPFLAFVFFAAGGIIALIGLFVFKRLNK